MKKLLSITLLAVLASGCAVFSPKNPTVLTPTIGMNLEDFKTANPNAGLVYLANDMATFKLYRTSSLNYGSMTFFISAMVSFLNLNRKLIFLTIR